MYRINYNIKKSISQEQVDFSFEVIKWNEYLFKWVNTNFEVKVMDANHRKLGLSDLLDQDLSCYEYYYSLSKELRNKIKEMDVNTFEEMQDIVQQEQGRES